MSISVQFLQRITAALLITVSASPVHSQDDPGVPDASANGQVFADMVPENQARWPYFATIDIPSAIGDNVPETKPQLVDFFATSDVFQHAATDLSDLRIYAADGNTIPYALRILSPGSVRDEFTAAEFNRSEPEDGVHELTLDLQRDDIEHNEVIVETTGTNYRRSVVISGSADAKDWKPLVSGYAVEFTSVKQTLKNQTFAYPNSRHRYLRIQVTPDPQTVGGTDQFTFQVVSVIRQLDVPGEFITTEAVVGPREPTRQYGTPGSRWILDFGAPMPFERLEVVVEDDEFARDVTLEAESLNEIGQSMFYTVYSNETTEWRRIRGEPAVPMILTFSEIRARRLRLTVADYRNKPLTLSSALGSGAARQIIIERTENLRLPLKLYFGNHDAETANYDFARNLPESLTVEPVPALIHAAEANPAFVPPPQALTERFPWLIYVALCSVSLVLGIVIMNLSKAAIAIHDAAKEVT